jgi:hypothetical protein
MLKAGQSNLASKILAVAAAFSIGELPHFPRPRSNTAFVVRPRAPQIDFHHLDEKRREITATPFSVKGQLVFENTFIAGNTATTLRFRFFQPENEAVSYPADLHLLLAPLNELPRPYINPYDYRSYSFNPQLHDGFVLLSGVFDRGVITIQQIDSL